MHETYPPTFIQKKSWKEQEQAPIISSKNLETYFKISQRRDCYKEKSFIKFNLILLLLQIDTKGT